jgi:hypothetical protein
MALVFLLAISICLAYAALFLSSGRRMLEKSGGFCHLSPALLGYMGFFAGAALFIFFLSIGGVVLASAKLSLIASTALLLAIAAWGKKAQNVADLEWAQGLASKFAPVFMAVGIVLLLIWLPPLNNPDGTIKYNHDLFGSANSGRYANIAEYMVSEDRLPVVNQNFGQSLLAAPPLLMGVDLPYFSIYLWLAVSMAFAVLAFYELFRHFKIPSQYAAAGVFVLFLGNSALSLTHVMTIDSGSPLLANGYTDNIFSLMTFLIFLLWASGISNNLSILNAPSLAIPAVLGFAWNITSAQNIFFAAFVMLYVLAMAFFAKKGTASIALALFVLLAFAAAGATRGGMLFPKQLDSYRSDIVGSFTPNAAPILQYKPGVSYFFMGPYSNWVESHVLTEYFSQNLTDDGMEKEISSRRSELTINYGPLKTVLLSILKLQYYVFYHETLLFDFLRTFFFPIAGMILAWLLTRNGSKEAEMQLMNPLAAFMLIVLLLGFFMAFSVSIGNFKAEFMRFLIVPYWLGLALLVASFWHLTRRLEPRTLILAWLLLAFVMTAGPIFDLCLNIGKNLLISSHGIGFWQRISDLATMGWRLTIDYLKP